MNQSEAFLFFDKLWIFPTGGGRENTNEKTQRVCIFSIFNPKNENKDKDKLENRCITLIELNISYVRDFFYIKWIKIEKVIIKKHFLASNSKLIFCTLSSWLVQK